MSIDENRQAFTLETRVDAPEFPCPSLFHTRLVTSELVPTIKLARS
jgi:hypothetical protein